MDFAPRKLWIKHRFAIFFINPTESFPDKGISMDLSIITAAVSALSAAKELGKAALGVRDFNEVAPVIAQLNDQLLKAQDALFRHNAELLSLQQEQFETAKKLREMEEALTQRGRYSLVELSRGHFAYRVNIAPVNSDVGNPVSAEPLHHVCQPCFDKGVKAVLQRHSFYGAISLDCPICGKGVSTGETEPFSM
jgi:hypothetical protein